MVKNNNIKSLQKTICTCDDEQNGPKTEQQSNKELNDHQHQSSFPKTLDIKLPHLQSFSNMNNIIIHYTIPDLGIYKLTYSLLLL